jgi:hypothetical protein
VIWPATSTNRVAFSLALAAVIIHASVPVAAAHDGEQAAGALTKPVKLVTLDLAVPDSPAFTILGLSPETVVRPGSPRDLATTVLNGVDRRGNLQSGLAIDFAPLFLFAGSNVTHGDYRGSAATRLAGRTQLSIATAKGAGSGDKSLRAAFGLRTTLWDAGDPRLDETLIMCMDNVPIPKPTTVVATQAAQDAWIAKVTSERRPLIEQCHKQFKARRWNASSFAIGAAPSWQSPTGSSGDFQFCGVGVWASLALGLSVSESTTTSTGATITGPRPIGQVVVQGRYRNKELVPNKTAAGTFFEQDSSGLGLRLLLGAADRGFVFESEFARQSPEGEESSTTAKLSVGGQLKLTTDLWLSLAVGANRGGPANEERSGFVLSTFKWALSREPSFTP